MTTFFGEPLRFNFSTQLASSKDASSKADKDFREILGKLFRMYATNIVKDNTLEDVRIWDIKDGGGTSINYSDYSIDTNSKREAYFIISRSNSIVNFTLNVTLNFTPSTTLSAIYFTLPKKPILYPQISTFTIPSIGIIGGASGATAKINPQFGANNWQLEIFPTGLGTVSSAWVQIMGWYFRTIV